MNRYKNASFIKLFIRFFIIFFIIVALIKIFTGFFRFEGLEGLKREYFIDGKWQLFLKNIWMMSMIYGIFMTVYYKFIKK
jgi:hypothetical protein